MTRRTKRLLLLAMGVLLIGCALVGWTTVKIVAWVRDFPNRIVIDGDATAASFGAAVTEYYHHALEKGDSTMRLQVINEQFIPMINGHTEAATWVRNEYRNGDQYLDTPKLIEHGASPVTIALYCLLTIGSGYVGFRRSCVTALSVSTHSDTKKTQCVGEPSDPPKSPVSRDFES